jgi:hypothetical protein
MELHYTAAAEKRPPQWAASERPKHLPRDWNREYEIAWTVPEGEPVVPEYSAQVHERRLLVRKGCRLLRGWDFGYVSPVVLFAQWWPTGQLVFLAELCPFNTPLDQLIPMTHAITVDLVGPFEATRAYDAGDPEVESQTDLGSIASVLSRYGIRVASSRPGTEVSYGQFRKRFTQSVFVPGQGLEPQVLVDPVGCPNLAEALRGTFHLSPHPPYKPVKAHPHKDLCDAARYLSDNLDGSQRDYQSMLTKMSTADVDQYKAPAGSIVDDASWMTGGVR